MTSSAILSVFLRFPQDRLGRTRSVVPSAWLDLSINPCFTCISFFIRPDLGNTENVMDNFLTVQLIHSGPCINLNEYMGAGGFWQINSHQEWILDEESSVVTVRMSLMLRSDASLRLPITKVNRWSISPLHQELHCLPIWISHLALD